MIRVEFGKEITSILQDRKIGNWKNKWTILDSLEGDARQ